MSTNMKCLVTALAIILIAGMCIPASYAQDRTIQLYRADNSTGAFLGIRMTDVTKENMSEYKLDRPQGVIVESVVEESPAESAGLQAKDVILEFDGVKVRSTVQFSRLVKETPVGREVQLSISRAGKRNNIAVQLAGQSEQRAEGRAFVVPAPLGDSGRGDPIYRFRFNEPFPESWFPGDGTPRLGISIQSLTDQLAGYLGVPGNNGILVTSVMEGSPSAGKLQAGDVIVRADGQTVSDPANLRRILQRTTSETISLDVVRNKREIKVVVDLSGDAGKEGGSGGKEYKL